MITLRPPFRAEDMAGLFKKVLKGIYPKIPVKYSQELSSMVRLLLQVSPNLRPTCEKILKMPMIVNKIEKLIPDILIDDADQNILLQTIRVPKNLMFLTDKLPKPFYEDEEGKRNTSDFSKINKSDSKQNKRKRMNKIEEADEEKEKDKKPKRKVNVQKSLVEETLPDITPSKDTTDLKKEEISNTSKKTKTKKSHHYKNISMDMKKDKNEEMLININSISPAIANILLRKQKQALLKQLISHSKKKYSSVLDSPYNAVTNKKVAAKKEHRDSPQNKIMESIGKSIKVHYVGNGQRPRNSSLVNNIQ